MSGGGITVVHVVQGQTWSNKRGLARTIGEGLNVQMEMTLRANCSLFPIPPVYGKWAFYRFGPFQEPFSILMSLGNLWVNLQGLRDLKRRVRTENRLRVWLYALGCVQVNTWIWSSVFHARGECGDTGQI